MRYLLLIYGQEDPNRAPDPTEMKRWYDYTADLQKAGVYHAGDALQPSMTATTVRNRDGETVTTDGPFAETKEVLGGYYLIECDTLDQALEWAARCPGADYGSIEVRPIMELPEAPA